MDPPEGNGPDTGQHHDQDPQPADQERRKARPAHYRGRHRKARRKRRFTATHVAEFVKCAPAVIRIADELKMHETPIRDNLIGVVQQIVDALHGIFF